MEPINNNNINYDNNERKEHIRKRDIGLKHIRRLKFMIRQRHLRLDCQHGDGMCCTQKATTVFSQKRDGLYFNIDTYCNEHAARCSGCSNRVDEYIGDTPYCIICI